MPFRGFHARTAEPGPPGSRCLSCRLGPPDGGARRGRLSEESAMLEQQRFLVKQQVSLLSGRADYDIFNPDTQQQVGTARESRGFLKTILTMALAKKKRPRTIEVRDSAGAPV